MYIQVRHRKGQGVLPKWKKRRGQGCSGNLRFHDGRKRVHNKQRSLDALRLIIWARAGRMCGPELSRDRTTRGMGGCKVDAVEEAD